MMPVVVDKWADICPQITFRDSDHTPSNRRYGQWKGSGELSVKAFRRVLSVTATETGGPRDGRQSSRSISIEVDPITLRDFLNREYPA